MTLVCCPISISARVVTLGPGVRWPGTGMWRTMGVRMGASKPKKRSVALVVVEEDDPSKVLLVWRPEDDEEFPGMWGLPAGSLRSNETYEEVARRIGTQSWVSGSGSETALAPAGRNVATTS